MTRELCVLAVRYVPPGQTSLDTKKQSDTAIILFTSIHHSTPHRPYVAKPTAGVPSDTHQILLVLDHP